MAQKKVNSFDKKATKKKILTGLSKGLDTKHNVKNTAMETGKDVLIGVVGGGLAGAAIGRPSLIIGLGVAGLGHYMDFQPAKLLGLGLMAANGFQDKSLKGLKGVDGVKERVHAYKTNFSEKLYLPEIIHKVHPNKAVNGIGGGVGEIQHFSYPQDLGDMRRLHDNMDDEDLAMEYLDKQIESSGVSHMQRNNMNMDDMELATMYDEQQPKRQRQVRQPDVQEAEAYPYPDENAGSAQLTYSHSEPII